MIAEAFRTLCRTSPSARKFLWKSWYEFAGGYYQKKDWKQSYKIPGLKFVPGDAEFLPFANNRFDVVINVESSHCYRSMQSFIRQAFRVLKIVNDCGIIIALHWVE
jgi:SAM-dependent methyltransferase